ncbi:DDE-type integrase/transposase/recombinase [Subtercola lobariae]|uniref:Integrase catalytic domain-containing protein n=1 Tax=Subtercola lobariae TaxID=1588641 RepID=A0A917BH58_9MICO|nr:DDE-type integrase/transposase/recombinase [Subtercola lobariae]GGF41593.1 hypothetical protein GCM10011399_37830 [Subtercola lobariae]
MTFSVDPGLTLATKGDTAYRDRFELVFRRNANRPNEQWQADHTLLDLAVLGKEQSAVRPWLTIFAVFMGGPNAEQTALALHQAINPKTSPPWPISGLPDILYSDHGSDFTCVRLERVCLDAYVRLIHSRPGVPQGRGKIEPFYRTITTELLPHLPGHVPHDTNGELASDPALTLEQLDRIVEKFIVDEDNIRQHSETIQAPVESRRAPPWSSSRSD